MDIETLWGHIHRERRYLADVLKELSAEEWAHDSLCAGWTVQDVAAHIISSPQIRWRDFPAVVIRGGFSYNRMIFREAKRLGQAPVEHILADYATYDGSRHYPPMTSPVEPLTDILVHTQDILRPLGRHHDVPAAAAATAADRSRRLAMFLGSRRVVRSVRMIATDTDWDRGTGPVIEGPMLELLMLCAGRTGDPDRLSGVGIAALTHG